MGERTRSASGFRVAWLLLAMCALSLRVLIPQGFMTAPAQDTPFALVICTGQGAIQVSPDKAPAHAGDSETGAQHAPCAFAGLSATPTPPDLSVNVAAVVYPAARPIAFAELALVSPGRGLAAPPPPATAPPSLSI